jgi:alpha-galactosidase
MVVFKDAEAGDAARGRRAESTLSPGIYYDGSRRLFRLRCKDTLYAFRVDDQRNLEHLYWGPALPADDDITYLTRAHVPAPFDPRGNVSLAEKLGLDELDEITEGGQALTESWRVFTREKNDPNVSKTVRLKSRRLENASWRMWHMERMSGGDLNRDLSEGVLTEALQAPSNGAAPSQKTSTAAATAAAAEAGVGSLSGGGGAEAADIHSPLHPDRAVAAAPGRRHPSPRPLRSLAPSHQVLLGPATAASAVRTPPSPHPVHARPHGGGDLSASYSSSPFGLNTLAVADASALGSPLPHSPYALGRVPVNGDAAKDDGRVTEATIDANGSSSKKREEDEVTGLIAGLDLDGYRGSRQHFRAHLKSRLENTSMPDVRHLGQAAEDNSRVALSPSGPTSAGAPFTAMLGNSSASSAVGLTPHHTSPITGGHLKYSASATAIAAMSSTWDTSLLGSQVAPEARLLSPAAGLGRGMGSRKPSFVALESHAVVDPADPMFELNQLASATNWEQLDPEVVGKSSKLLEFSDCGTGDFREPSFKVRYDSDGSTVAPLEYSKHRIFKGKPAMPNYMPGLYVESPSEATTLVVEMVDRVTDLKISLYFTVYHEYDVITRRSVASNDGDKVVCLAHLVSTTVDFDAESRFYMTQLSGGWARERQIVTRKLDDGLTVIKSSRGASSHQFNPFLVISPDREPNEKGGECFAFCLVYSGNFLATAEVSEYRRLRVNLGINPEGFTWELEPSSRGIDASTFHSPEVIMSYSNSGTGGMSRQLHRLFRERLIPAAWRYKIPPVLLNTWEAAYFNVSHDIVMDIARKAATAGIELLVLDDGWFGKRNDTYSGLGDWTPNMRKLPHGLHGLAKEVNELGMKFGIWVEPEMVSMDSELYRQHPDWCLHVPSRARTTGRNQLVLDFSRPCVRDNIFEQLRTMLASANIEYVKWDMNRHLTEVFSQDWDARRQGEISHRYMLGVYEVFSRITSAFPEVLFESCSGGGGRFDAGMLFFSPQVWTSDNTDALSRVRIQYGTSLAYPACTMGAHVSTVPNHQTLRSTTVKTRSLIAMSGTFGYELDPRLMVESDIAEIQTYISLHKCIAPLVYEGDMYRLWSPFDSDSGAWMFVSRDKGRAVVIATNVRRDVGRLEPRLRLDGLVPEMVYNVEELCPGTMARNPDTGAIDYEPRGVYQYGRILSLSGATLCRAGLPIKFMFDADSVVFEVREAIGSL